ncbi:MAG: sulfotransferase [Anaerolineae bacterium]|nr:MAG: sulfotransferase [Anaerolineae bacterium]
MVVVFIAGLSHSGSTLLDLLLGAHSRLVGLGELDRVLDFPPEKFEEERVMPCTCGQPVRECPFWAGAFDRLAPLPPADRRAALLAHFAETFGPDTALVDSSKYLPALERLRAVPDADIKVLHIIKDVRGFTVSQRDALDKELRYASIPLLAGSKTLTRLVHRLTTRQPLYLFLKWARRNRAIRDYCAAHGLPRLAVSYDRLCHSPEAALTEICSFLGVPYEPAMLVPLNTGSHIFWGNPMAGNRERHARIEYDDRWKTRRDWRLAARLLPGVLRENREWVGE